MVHFAQDGTTRRSSAGSSGGGGYSSGVPVTSGAPSGGSLFREDSGEERLGTWSLTVICGASEFRGTSFVLDHWIWGWRQLFQAATVLYRSLNEFTLNSSI